MFFERLHPSALIQFCFVELVGTKFKYIASIDLAIFYGSGKTSSLTALRLFHHRFQLATTTKVLPLGRVTWYYVSRL
jgi:hypothetical protein